MCVTPNRDPVHYFTTQNLEIDRMTSPWKLPTCLRRSREETSAGRIWERPAESVRLTSKT